MTDHVEVIDEFLTKRQKHRAARDAEEDAYYTAQAAKEKIFRALQLNPYNREHTATVNKAIRERDKELSTGRPAAK